MSRCDRLVRAGNNPRRQIALRHGTLHRPGAAGRLRAHGHKCHAAGGVRAEQLTRVIERLGCEKVDLARQGEVAEQRGRTNGLLRASKPVLVRLESAVRHPHIFSRHVFQDAARQVPQPPCGFAAVFGIAGLVGAVGNGRGDRQRRPVEQAERGQLRCRGIWSRRGLSLRGAGALELNGRRRTFLGAQLDRAAARLPVAARPHAQNIGTEWEIFQRVAAVAVGGRHRNGTAHHRDHGAGNRRLVGVVEDPPLDDPGRERIMLRARRGLRVRSWKVDRQ